MTLKVAVAASLVTLAVVIAFMHTNPSGVVSRILPKHLRLPPPTPAPRTSSPSPAPAPPPLTSPPSTPPPLTSPPPSSHSDRFPVVTDDVLSNTTRPVFITYYSTPPDTPDSPPFGVATFVYLAMYTRRHAFPFAYYIPPSTPPPPPSNTSLPPGCLGMKDICRHGSTFKCHNLPCVGPHGCLLHPAWCKVKALIQGSVSFPQATLLLWLDTDAIISFERYNTNFGLWVDHILQHRGKPLETHPFVANQEQPSWWCNFLRQHNGSLGVHFRYCVNSGVFFVRPSERGKEVLHALWHSSLDNYSLNPTKLQFRTSWPWEQDRVVAVIHEKRFGVQDKIQVLPDPDRYFQRDWDVYEKIPGSCLSAVPVWRCIVNHFCGTVDQKIFWGNHTMFVALAQAHACATGPFNITVPADPTYGYDARPPSFPLNMTMNADNSCHPETQSLAVPKPTPPPSMKSPEFLTWYPHHFAEILRLAKALAPQYVRILP